MSTKITVHLWPKGFLNEGKRVDDDAPKHLQPSRPAILVLTPSDAELMIAEYEQWPELFEQEAAQSIRSVLNEWIEETSTPPPSHEPKTTTQGAEYYDEEDPASEA